MLPVGHVQTYTLWTTNSAKSRAMRQRILGSHTPPCHRRMVITTQFNVLPSLHCQV